MRYLVKNIDISIAIWLCYNYNAIEVDENNSGGVQC